MQKTLPRTLEMAQCIEAAAAEFLGCTSDDVIAFFEYDQWWIEELINGARWSVEDTENDDAVDGLSFVQSTKRRYR